MIEFKGTPGPWIVDVRGGCVAVYQDGRQEDTNGCHRCDDRNIAYSNKGAEYDEVVGFWSMDRKTIYDYRLIAAAPELLEAIQDMLSGWKYIRAQHGDLYGVGWERSEQKAIAAIAKALGETNE